MTISYPLSLPTSRGVAHVHAAPQAVVAIGRSPFTLSEQVQEWPGQQWQFDVTMPVMTEAEADDWVCFLLKLNGRRGTFLFGDPARQTARGALGGTPLVNGASQTGNQLVIDGCSHSITNWIKKGDYIQLGAGSSSRLHKALDNVNTDSSGNATLLLWPNLRTSPADNQAVITTTPKGVFRMATNVMTWDADPPTLYNMSFGCAEAL